MAEVSLRKIVKDYDDVEAVKRRSTSTSPTRNSSCWSALGLRQVDDLAHDRRARGHHRWRNPGRRRSGQRRAAEGPRHGDGVPELRALPAHDGLPRTCRSGLVVQQSCIFAITAVIFKALIGFIVAHFVHNIPSKGQRKWRGMLLVPWVIPPAMSCLAWLWLFDPVLQRVQLALRAGRRIDPVAWTGDANWARPP